MIFYYTTGKILEWIVVLVITFMVAVLLISIVLTVLLYRAIKNKANMPLKEQQPAQPEKPAQFDKELELEKIKIVKENFQMYFNLGGSILSGGLIAFLVLIITLFYSGQLGNGLFGLLIGLGLALGVGGIMGFAFWHYDRHKRKFLKCSDEWIIKVGKGEQLSIDDMQKQLKEKQYS